MTVKVTVKRVNASVLGAFERPLLAWLAKSMPSWVIPNHLTFLGVCGAVLAAAGFCLTQWSIWWLWLASIGLVANWFGDSLDGTLARYRQIERPRFGFFVDHTCDLFSQAIIFLSIGLSSCAHLASACLALIAFLMAFVFTLIGTQVRNTMRITYFGFGPTEIRALLLIGNLFVLAFGVIDVHAWFRSVISMDWISLHDVVMSSMSIATMALLAVLAIRDAREIAAEDPSPIVRQSDASNFLTPK
jgi:archaetidylinositol phosphate synthase